MESAFRAVPNGTIRLTAVTVAGAAPTLANLPAGGGCTVLIQNRGTVPVLVAFGAKAAMDLPTAPSDTVGGARSIPVGGVTTVRLQQGERHVAIATAGGTPDIEFTVGDGDGGVFAIAGAGGGGGGGSANPYPGADYATSARQDTTNTALGAPADSAATSDTGTFGLVALAKRGLGNWTTLLARIPALVLGRVPVDGSGVIQPVAAQDGFRPWGTAGGTASSVAVLGPNGTPAVIDTAGYNSVSFQPINIAAGSTVTIQRSLDGTTWLNAAGRSDTGSGTTVDGSALTAGQGIVTVPAGGLLRVNQTAYGGAGTTTVVVTMNSTPALARNVIAKAFGLDGTADRQIKVTTSGALEPPTAGTGKIVETIVSLAASTSTVLVAANANRIALEIQPDGVAIVGISLAGATLTGTAPHPKPIPTGSYPLYTAPIAPLGPVTAYTETAQKVRVTEYLR